MIAFTRYRTDPPRRLAETAKALAEGEPSARRARRDLADYTYLLDREVTSNDAVTDWIVSFKDVNALPHSMKRWRATKSVHWLLAAMAHVEETNPAVPELLRAAAQVPRSSPAYVSLSHYRARLLLAQKKRAAAREVLDAVLSIDKLPPSTLNALREQRRPLARSLDEYLRDLPGIPVGDSATKIAPYPQTDPLLAPDAAETINVTFPHHLLVEAALNERVPPSIRKQLVAAAYVRAAMLGNEEWQAQLAPDLKKFFGITAGNPLDLLLDYPFLQPYVNPLDSRIYNLSHALTDVVHGSDENWWCRDGDTLLGRYAHPAAPVVPQFLATTEMRRLASRDREALLAHGSGATYLLRHALARAKSGHPRAAETLSRAVRGTRWTCADKRTADLARQAFNTLHRRYAKTRWARETKYWYHGFSY